MEHGWFGEIASISRQTNMFHAKLDEKNLEETLAGEFSPDQFEKIKENIETSWEYDVTFAGVPNVPRILHFTCALKLWIHWTIGQRGNTTREML